MQDVCPPTKLHFSPIPALPTPLSPIPALPPSSPSSPSQSSPLPSSPSQSSLLPSSSPSSANRHLTKHCLAKSRCYIKNQLAATD
ncbi:hypothetical protein Pmani_025462 [Petrolisthes manimaculis]|uniref:Uncharacterized protein n=1 Tax=Petrolisthes manimaculis TaxID=1843537 RepID=A0AAE1TYW9_9EUCA|nr:hypothetical protein Pmani_025462 [Petrolisthes manimaculis]